MACFPDPAAGPFTAFGIDVQLFACIPYPQHTLSPGLVFAGHQWAVDGPENGAAVKKTVATAATTNPVPVQTPKGLAKAC